MKKTGLITSLFVAIPLVLNGCGSLDKTLDYLAKKDWEARKEESRQEQLQFEQNLHVNEIQRMKSYYKNRLSSLPPTEKRDLFKAIAAVDEANRQAKNYDDKILKLDNNDLVNIKHIWFNTYSLSHVWMNVTFWPYYVRLDYAFDINSGEIIRIIGFMWGGSHILVYDKEVPRNNEPFVPLTEADQKWVKSLGDHFFFEYSKIRGEELKNRLSVLSPKNETQKNKEPWPHMNLPINENHNLNQNQITTDDKKKQEEAEKILKEIEEREKDEFFKKDFSKTISELKAFMTTMEPSLKNSQTFNKKIYLQFLTDFDSAIKNTTIYISKYGKNKKDLFIFENDALKGRIETPYRFETEMKIEFKKSIHGIINLEFFFNNSDGEINAIKVVTKNKSFNPIWPLGNSRYYGLEYSPEQETFELLKNFGTYLLLEHAKENKKEIEENMKGYEKQKEEAEKILKEIEEREKKLDELKTPKPR